MQFSSSRFIGNALLLGDQFQKLFDLQGVKPYLPDKKDIVEFETDDILTKRYKSKVMPWDIEEEHMVKNRERLKAMPIGIKWSKEELEKYNALTDIKEKRDVILKKSELKSVYIPHLKWDKEMIKFPNMPHDARSKDAFKKGYDLYSKEKYDEAYPLLMKAYKSGNYVAAQLVATILFHRLMDDEIRQYYFAPKHIYAGVESWIKSNPNKNKKIIQEHDKLIADIRKIANNLIRQGLPVGYFLYANTYYHYLKNLCDHEFDIRYREHYITYLMEAANRGSYDAYMRLAIDYADIEWLLCAMIVSHEYKCFDIFTMRINKYLHEYPTPRTLAIVRLAAMWGSNYALDCLTYGETGNFIDSFNHNVLRAYPNGAIDMPDREQVYRGNIYRKYYGQATGVFEGTLIPDLDTVYPPKPVIYSPYSLSDFLHAIFKENKTYPHPLSPEATDNSILRFREFIHNIEQEGWVDEDTLEYTIKYRDSCSYDDARRYMVTIEFNDIDRLFGYLNAMKIRELKQHPLYYPSGRPYMYPDIVYKKHPDWY